MKITKVEPLVIKVPQEDTFGGHGRQAGEARGYFTQPGWRGAYSNQSETTLVRIETDSGLVGYGEGQSPIAPEATAAVIEQLLGPYLLGRDPEPVQVLQREMYAMMNIRGHYSGHMAHAISAVDVALWDILGKSAGKPVAALLGGAFRTRIPVYVSGIRGKSVDDKVATIQSFVEKGFTALKTFLGFGVEEDLSHVEAFSAALKGKGRLMVDALWNYDVFTATRLGRALERSGVFWFEAPTAPEDIAGHAAIAHSLDLPVAAGETETSRYQFRSWLEQKALDIAQPDVARCGITESKCIADLCDAFHTPVAYHSGISLAPAIAATMQVAAATQNLLYQEYQPVITDLANRFLKKPIVCTAGYFELPSAPGLGIEIDEAALEPFIVKRA